jgi:1-acyl-sn-glycerol-3-phosphate acyltransferase
MKLPMIGFFFRHAKVIPIAGQKEDPAMLEESFRIISSELRAGELVCIFPEGEITRNGKMAPFRKGVERILKSDPVPVIPVALDGMWGSFFSRRHGRAMSKPFRRVWSRVSLRIGSKILPEGATSESLESAVGSLLKE